MIMCFADIDKESIYLTYILSLLPLRLFLLNFDTVSKF